MIDWTVKHLICGIEELDAHEAGGITHVLSILDPDMADPAPFARMTVEREVLRFHDVIRPTEGQIMPEARHVAAALAFARSIPDPDPAHLLVHCHMGISRSVAAMTAIILQAHPRADEDEVLAHIHAIRPKAWPNLRMIEHADSLLGRGGRLIAAAGRHYARQLAAHPKLAAPLIGLGREEEVAIGRALLA